MWKVTTVLLLCVVAVSAVDLGEVAEVDFAEGENDWDLEADRMLEEEEMAHLENGIEESEVNEQMLDGFASRYEDDDDEEYIPTEEEIESASEDEDEGDEEESDDNSSLSTEQDSAAEVGERGRRGGRRAPGELGMNENRRFKKPYRKSWRSKSRGRGRGRGRDSRRSRRRSATTTAPATGAELVPVNVEVATNDESNMPRRRPCGRRTRRCDPTAGPGPVPPKGRPTGRMIWKWTASPKVRNQQTTQIIETASSPQASWWSLW